MARCKKTSDHSNSMTRHCLTLFLLISVIGTSESVNTAESSEQYVRPSVVREYLEHEQLDNYDELLEKHGHNKKLPTGFELQALIALSHYPELNRVKINFIVEDVSIPLSSRPHWSTMLRSAKNRTYQIIIDKNLDGPREVLLLKNQPFNAQIGIIGHELAHTVYYLDRSVFGIISDALCQFSNCRIQFERATDRRLIDYGLGWQRLDHSSFVRRRLSNTPETVFTSELGSAYMGPAELMRIIESHEAYALFRGVFKSRTSCEYLS